jgi:hypothetical protein
MFNQCLMDVFVLKYAELKVLFPEYFISRMHGHVL